MIIEIIIIQIIIIIGIIIFGWRQRYVTGNSSVLSRHEEGVLQRYKRSVGRQEIRCRSTRSNLLRLWSCFRQPSLMNIRHQCPNQCPNDRFTVIEEYLKAHETITTASAAKLLDVQDKTAQRLLTKAEKLRILSSDGKTKDKVYRRAAIPTRK